mgnify:CR=1 FL=1
MKAKLFVYDNKKYYHPLMLIIRDYFKVFEDKDGEEKMIEWFKKHFELLVSYKTKESDYRKILIDSNLMYFRIFYTSFHSMSIQK